MVSKNRKSNVITRPTRDTLDIANSISLLRWLATFRPLVLPSLLEDRRQYHPDRQFRKPLAYPRAAAALVVSTPSRSSKFPRSRFRPSDLVGPNVSFVAPKRVAVCVRRKTRREVLFARGVGGGKVRKGKRNYLSQFSCGGR